MRRVAALVLAAGASRRFRAAAPDVPTKLVALLDGKPLVRHAAEAARASRAWPVVVVTGHARRKVEAALAPSLVFVHNADFAQGLSTSLRAGLSALPDDVEGVVVLLGDMPRISADLIDRLIAAFSNAPDAEAAVPVQAGRRGNPALLARALFAQAAALSGDEGARRLLAGARVVEVEVADAAVTLDIDDPATLRGIEGT